jgi:hypothetical protein
MAQVHAGSSKRIRHYSRQMDDPQPTQAFAELRLMKLGRDRNRHSAGDASLASTVGDATQSAKTHSKLLKARKPGGWPAWEFNAKQILDSICEHVRRRGENRVFAVADFVKILDLFLSQLINWAEQKKSVELRNWAGMILADRVQFLFAQHRDWHNGNEGFKKRQNEFGDRRGARTPREYLAWLAGDYLRALVSERLHAAIRLSPPPGEPDGPTTAELLDDSKEYISWLRRLRDMPDFGPACAKQWADIVFERMQHDEHKILNSTEMRNRKPRPDIAARRSHTRIIVRSGKLSVKPNKHCPLDAKVRLHQFHSTIIRAVVSLASKPVGNTRGITRPA